jgi:nucleoside-triphosphatase
LLQKRILLLTGAPGIGKTTVLIKAVDALKAEGISVGGMVSRETREGNTRVGFEIIDLAKGKKGWLAHVNQKTGPQVGKYHVNTIDLENIGVQAIVDATEKSYAIAIDEIGPMELFSQEFKQAVKKALESGKPMLVVVHAKARDPLITYAMQRDNSELFTIKLVNRESLSQQLCEKVLSVLLQAKSSRF